MQGVRYVDKLEAPAPRTQSQLPTWPSPALRIECVHRIIFLHLPTIRTACSLHGVALIKSIRRPTDLLFYESEQRVAVEVGTGCSVFVENTSGFEDHAVCPPCPSSLDLELCHDACAPRRCGIPGKATCTTATSSVWKLLGLEDQSGWHRCVHP